MNDNSAGHGGGTASVPIEQNEYVQDLFALLNENGKDTSGLTALINHINGMESFVKQAEEKISVMQAQIDTMKELQDHSLKAKLQNTVNNLTAAVADIKERLSDLKNNIISGCKNALTEFKEKGVTALDKVASFFHIKDGLQAIKNRTVKSAQNCDMAVSKVEAFSKQYHSAGLGLKNMGRLLTGKAPVDAAKEAGKLSKAASAPFRAEKVCMLKINRQADKVLSSLDALEQKAEVSRAKREAVPKKPKLTEKLAAKKAEINRREIENPMPKRTAKAQGAEI